MVIGLNYHKGTRGFYGEPSHESVVQFVLSLIGGLIVSITGIFGVVWFSIGGPDWTGFGGWMGV